MQVNVNMHIVYFATKIVGDGMLLYCTGSVIRDDLGQALNPHDESQIVTGARGLQIVAQPDWPMLQRIFSIPSPNRGGLPILSLQVDSDSSSTNSSKSTSTQSTNPVTCTSVVDCLADS